MLLTIKYEWSMNCTLHVQIWSTYLLLGTKMKVFGTIGTRSITRVLTIYICVYGIMW